MTTADELWARVEECRANAVRAFAKHFSPRVLRLIMSLIEELNTLEARIASLSDEIEARAAEDEPCQRLRPCRASASSSRAPSSR